MAHISLETLEASKQDFLLLLAKGCKLAEGLQSEHTLTLHEEERLGKLAASYTFAAQALLGGMHELYSELVDHPQYVILRRVARSYAR
jgi:hypothetical protein